MELKPWLKSSQDGEKVSNTIKGVVTMLSGSIIFIGTNLFGLVLTGGDVIDFAAILGTAGGAMWMIYGAVMKLVMLFGKVKNPVVVE